MLVAVVVANQQTLYRPGLLMHQPYIDMIAACSFKNPVPGIYAQCPALTLWLMLTCSHTAQHDALSTANLSNLHVPPHAPSWSGYW